VVGASEEIHEVPGSTVHADIACMGALRVGLFTWGGEGVSSLVPERDIQSM